MQDPCGLHMALRLFKKSGDMYRSMVLVRHHIDARNSGCRAPNTQLCVPTPPHTPHRHRAPLCVPLAAVVSLLPPPAARTPPSALQPAPCVLLSVLTPTLAYAHARASSLTRAAYGLPASHSAIALGVLPYVAKCSDAPPVHR